MEFQFSDTDKSPAFFCDENGGAGDKDKVELVGEKSEPKNKPKETSFSFVNALSFDAGSFSSGEFSHKILKRRNSLIETLNSGVCSDPGPKPSNEDVYSVVSWRKSPDKLEKPEDTKKNNNTASEEAPKSETIDASAEPATKKQKREEPEKKPDQEVDMFSQYAFFAVYDGHGGIQAAEYVNNHLLKNIIFNQHFPSDVEQAIFAAFLTTDEQFAAYAKEKNIDGSVGTTVTFALIVGNTLYIANVGDSEAVLCSNGVANKITVAHSLANPNEKQRIEQSDGKIVTTSTSLRLGHPTWNSKLINIAVTRSIGDLYFKDPEYTQNKQSGLIAEPFITKRTITKQDDFLLIASDGFWDKMKTEDAVEYVTVNGAKDCDTLCRELVEISRARKSKDNITVLLIKFKPLGAGSFNFAI